MRDVLLTQAQTSILSGERLIYVPNSCVLVRYVRALSPSLFLSLSVCLVQTPIVDCVDV